MKRYPHGKTYYLLKVECGDLIFDLEIASFLKLGRTIKSHFTQ